MKIAVEGCMHGDLEKVYETIQYIQNTQNIKIDLLLCCGDFQAIRNENDMESLNVPRKYREMKSFWKYYSGKLVAPVPTIFIGGNHEASNYLWELYYGGWAAPNIYFLGYAGVVKFGSLRIAGLSGIYKSNHYYAGHYERSPYNESTIRSVYHVREFDVHKLMQLEQPIDIFISHDWPVGITDYGDSKKLVREKMHFEKEVSVYKILNFLYSEEGTPLILGRQCSGSGKTLGSKPAAQLLQKLRPPYWFSAHLHCKFTALVQHGEGGPVTKFLALDKCLPRRKFLQVIEVESDPGPYEIQYDEEWLAITRKFNSIFPLTSKSANFGDVKLDIQECHHWVRNKLQARGSKLFDFALSAPSHNPSQSIPRDRIFAHVRNPQTDSLLEFLELPYLLDGRPESKQQTQGGPNVPNSEDIPIDDVDESEELEDDLDAGHG